MKQRSGPPVIGVTVDTTEGDEDQSPTPAKIKALWLKEAYVNAVIAAGGLPLPLPVVASTRLVKSYLDLIDGLLITGGHFDIDPAFFGEAPIPQLGSLKPERTKMEFALYKAALKRGLPVFGVCGGFQLINVAHGGSLYQDIPAQVPGALRHEQKPAPSTQPSHNVKVTPTSLLYKATKKESLKVNSTHHQGVKEVGKGLTPVAIASDQIVEAFEGEGDSFLLAVQWHPELLLERDEPSLKIYKAFVAATRRFAKER